MSKRFLTLNIGAASVELAEYELAGKSAPQLVNYGTARLGAPLDSGNAETILSPAILEIVREKGIRPGKVAVSVSGQMVFPKFAAIAMVGGAEKFEQMVRYEVEQQIPFPIDEMVCDRQILGDTENGDKSVMIVAAKVDQIEAITSAVSSAGFSPELVDVAPIAVTNALKFNRPESEGECSIILDIGAKTTSLVIVEGDKLYNRSIPVAGNTLTKEIAQALGCSPDEAEAYKLQNAYVSLGGVTEDEDEVADRVSKVCRAVFTRLNAEISRSINFYRSQQGGSAPARLYLTGGTALLPQAAEFFGDSLSVEVEYFNPFERIGIAKSVDASALDSDMAFLAASAGLALRWNESARFAINLLPPSLVEARAEAAKIPFVAAAGVAFVAALVLVMLGLGSQTSVIEAKRDAVAAKVERLNSFDKKVAAASERLAAAEAESQKLARLLASRSTAVQRVNAVRSSLIPGMWVEKWEGGRLTIRDWRDRVKGSAGKTAGELVIEKLKGKSAIDAGSVKIADMSSVGKDNQVEQFSVELKFK
jgi:type IV pilus assembly protein PilM